MKFNNYAQFKIVKAETMDKISKAYPDIKNKTGIYLFYRIVGYVGKSDEKDGILGRVATHCIKYEQHIDKSIHNRKLTCDGGEWHIKALCYCKSNEVDAMETKYIAEHLEKGVSLYNIESGGTEGKTDINERKERGGYKKGKEYGYNQAIALIRKLEQQRYEVKKDGTKTVRAEKAQVEWDRIVKGEVE